MSGFHPSPERAHTVAPTISMVDGEVVIVGPGAVAYSITLEAAAEMLARLAAVLAAASDAL